MAKGSFSGDDRARMSSSKFAETFHKTAALVSYRTRCGKETCRCARGDLHGPYWYLRWRDGEAQRRRYVRAAVQSARFDLRELRQWLKEIDRFLAN